MSSFLCFICHSTVNSDTNEDTREKYREVVGMNLCPDSHLCHICCHVLNKLWLFKSVCLKRSLEYPVLFSERGTLNLQRNDLEVHTVCPEDACGQYHNMNINSKSYHFHFENYDRQDNKEYHVNNSRYVELEDEANGFDEYFDPDDVITKEHHYFDSKNTQTSNYEHVFESKNTQTSNYEHVFENKNTQTDFKEELEVTDRNIDRGFKIEENSVRNLIDINDLEASHDDDNDPWTNFDRNNDNNNDDVEINNTHSPVNETHLELHTEGVKIEYTENDRELTNDLHEQQNKELSEETVKKKKKKKSKKKSFEKITLTVEQQKAELEGRRKEKKYIEAEFRCYNCALGFLCKDTYQTHMMRHEESNGEHRCAICTLRFASPAVVRAHRVAHAERYRCARCGESVRARRRHAHARAHRARDAHACHLCAGLFKDSSGLQQHLRRFHQAKTSSRTYSCSVCGNTYHSQATVRSHMIKHINRKFDCDKCESSFSSPYTLKQHKKKHEAIKEKQHFCTTCNLQYSSRKSLLAHRRNALKHQQTIYECPICSRVCPNHRSMASHMESVHSATKNYACPTCSSRYSNRKSLIRHMNSHRDLARPERRLAICHLCGAGFKGTSKLNRHLKEVCEKARLEEELGAILYEDQCMNQT